MAKRAIPPEEVKVLDINASFLGARTITLMERAGEAVARFVLDNSRPGARVAVISGKGNNGGDGFVAARYLAASARPDIFLVEPAGEIASEVSRANYERVKAIVRPIQVFEPRGYDVIIDAMLGVGLQGKPRETYARYIKLINESRRKIVSVDVPSGWPSEVAVRPDTTVTFHAPKEGMTPKNSGHIVVADIGIPPEAEKYCGPGDLALLPRRRKDAHKGDSGRVLVIGGGPYSGAPALAAMAAMRSGVDLAFVAVPEAVAIPVSTYSPNIIVKPLPGDILTPEHVPELLEFSKAVESVAIGPGLGNADKTLAAVGELIRRSSKPIVIDADAIVVCGKKPQILRGKSGVITPHAGEFKKLTGKTIPPDNEERRAEMVREAASRLKMTILQKGPVDVVSDGRFVKLNRTGNDAMTVGGTGDVLTGLVAGLLAQRAGPFAAGRIGAYVAGLAGDLAFEELSYGLLATDVIDKIPFVLRRYL